MYNYYYDQFGNIKQAGIMDTLGGMMPMAGGALAGAGAGAGLGSLLGQAGPAKMIAPIIGAAMGAYAASKVDNAIDQNAAGVDMNSQLAIQNGLMNLDQQQMLTNPYSAGMGMGLPPMGMGPGAGQMDGSGMGMGQGMGLPPMGMGPGGGAGLGAANAQTVASPDALSQMQKKGFEDSLVSDAAVKVFVYFNQ